MSVPTRLRQDESGVTLIELLISLVITGAIVLAMTGAILIGFRSTSSSDERLSQNRDVELVQGALPPDVMTSTAVTVNAAAASTCSGKASVLKLTWTTSSLVTTGTNPGPPVTTSKSYEVDYVSTVPAATPGVTPALARLDRFAYQTSGTNCTLVSSRTLATSLSRTVLPVAAFDAATKTVTLTIADSSGNKFEVRAKERS